MRLSVCIVACAIFALALAENSTTPKSPVSPTEPKPVTPKSTTTTEKPKSTTTTTIKTTTAAKNTTASKTTTASHNTTTPPAPHNTTTPVPPTPAPIPPKLPGQNNVTLYREVNGSRHVCFHAQMNYTLFVSYDITNLPPNVKPNNVKGSADVPIPTLATSDISGECDLETANVTMKWTWHNMTWSVEQTWSSAKGYFSLNGVTTSIPRDPQVLANVTTAANGVPIKTPFLYNATGLSEFKTQLGRSYHCDQKYTVKVNDNLSLHFTAIVAQAFKFDSNNATFSTDTVVCAHSSSPASRIIPIVVGCVLAGLIVIVILAYVVASRYKRYHGYETL